MIRGIRSIIKLVAKEVQIPPQYLYGIIMALSDSEDYPHVYIAYDNKNDDFSVGVSKLSYKIALIIWECNELEFDKFIGKIDKTLEALYNPKVNIYLCAKYLLDLYAKYKNWKKVYYVYNIGGDSNIDHYEHDKFVIKAINYSRNWFAE